MSLGAITVNYIKETSRARREAAVLVADLRAELRKAAA